MRDENVYAPPSSNLELPDVDNLATRWTRLWGALIDGIIASIIMFPIMFKTGYWENALAGNVALLDTLLLGVVGFILFMVLHGYLLLKHGQTIGKKLVGTRIVSINSNEILPLWKVLFVRYLPISIAANIPVIGQFLAIIDVLFIFRKNKRCVHDLIAGTKVVKASAH